MLVLASLNVTVHVRAVVEPDAPSFTRGDDHDSAGRSPVSTTSPGGSTNWAGAFRSFTVTRNFSDSPSPSSSSTVQVYSFGVVGSSGVVPVTKNPLRDSHEGNAGDSV